MINPFLILRKKVNSNNGPIVDFPRYKVNIESFTGIIFSS